MTKRNGTSLIQFMVIIGDIIILNILMHILVSIYPDFIPPYEDNTKIILFFCNLSMIVAQFIFHPIVTLRNIDFDRITLRVMYLVLTQATLFFITTKIIYNSGGLFESTLKFAPMLFCSILFARIIERGLLSLIRKRGRNVRRIMFIGSDPANLMVYNDLTKDEGMGYIAAGYYSNNDIENCPEGLKKLGTIDEFWRYIKEKDDEGKIPNTDDLFCSVSHTEASFLKDIMRYCDKHLIRFYYVPRMLYSINLGLKSERVGTIDLYTNHKEPLSEPICQFEKRFFDIVTSLMVCLFLLPFIPLIALIIFVQSPGPIFFTQKRTGIDGKTFKCFKFRSMHVNKNADTVQATEDDPRKFPFGNFMRKYNIDEFPQFVNVLIGDMSIVGPRPHMLLHTDVYSKLIDKYMVRHYYKPGITGWAQVTGFRGETKELWQMEERIKRDIWYIEHWSFSLDLKIVFMTAKSLIISDEKAY